MSIFITTLAFTDERYRDIAEISTLLAVVASVVVSLIYFRAIGAGKNSQPASRFAIFPIVKP